MTPYLAVGPVSLPVHAAAMRDHLRVDHDFDDSKIDALQRAAVAYLDGWSGLLGRCIMQQVWALDCVQSGRHFFPMPDVTTAFVGATAIDLHRIAMGYDFTLDAPATVHFKCKMADDKLNLAQAIVKLMVQRDYDMMYDRESAGIERSIAAMIAALRWSAL